MAKIMLSGTIPFLSFYAEHKVRGWITAAPEPAAKEPVAS